MKTITKFLFTAIFIIAITSCKEDMNLPFNKLSEEDNKALVENAAIKVAQNMSEITDEPAIDASINMTNYMSQSDPLSSVAGQKSIVTSLVEAVASLKSDEANIYTVMKSVANPAELNDDPETIQDIWDMLVGTYEWNLSTEDWDYTATPSDAIIFKFPSTENGSSNNAMLTISDYESVLISTPLEDEYDGDLPTSLAWDLKVDNSSLMSFTFAAEYNDDGIPSKTAADLTIGAFVFSVDATNNDKEISESFEFKNGKDVILGLSGGIEGDFTEANIDANTEVHTNTYTDYVYNNETNSFEEVQVTESWDEVHMEDMVNTGHAKFQVDNISIGCVADVVALIDKMDLIYPEDYYNDPSFDEQAAAVAEAAAMNEHLHMYAFNEDTRKKIADVEAYVVENEYGKGYWVDFRLVFGDESLVDLETYFEEGFENFVAEINGIISDLNDKYELGIDEMEY